VLLLVAIMDTYVPCKSSKTHLSTRGWLHFVDFILM